jgi:hypothetical protein
VLLDGTESSLSEIKKALGNAKSEKSAVWYYRESSMGELPQQAMEVLKLVIENICRSVCRAKPDLSDYIDEEGQSHPRR